MKKYRELSEAGQLDFHRRLDRLNFLICEFNRHSERKGGSELARRMSGRTIKHTLIFLFVVWGVIKILGYLEIWNPHEGTDYVFLGILILNGFIWLALEKPRFELEIENSVNQIASMRDEWGLSCGLWLNKWDIKLGADPDNAKKVLSWEACERVV